MTAPLVFLSAGTHATVILIVPSRLIPIEMIDLLRRGLGDGNLAKDTSAIEENVNAAEVGADRVDSFSHLIAIADVAGIGVKVFTAFWFKALGAPTQYGDGKSIIGKPDRRCAPQPSAAAGDHGNLRRHFAPSPFGAFAGAALCRPGISSTSLIPVSA